MTRPPLAHLFLGATAFLLSTSCYWLAQYSDLSSAFGDAGAVADAHPIPDGETNPTSDSGPLDAASGFCPPDAGPLAYCMDFDHVDAGALPLEVSGATAGIVDTTSVSPPNSLLVTLTGTNSSGEYDVSFPLQPTKTTLEFQIQSSGVEQGVTTLAITLLEPATQTLRKLSVVVAQDQTFAVQEYVAFADGGSLTNGHAFHQADAGVATPWHHVVLTLIADDGTKQYSSGLAVDGQVFEDGGALLLPWTQGEVGLEVGVTYAQSGNYTFFFDNVLAGFTL